MAFGETIPADEAARFAAFADEIAALQKRRSDKSGETERALHVKQHLGAVGELVVCAGDSLQAGVFANLGQTWPVYARFSNGSSKRQRDRVFDVRGFAIKLVGVPGRKLIEGLEAAKTQDFLFIDSHTVAVKNPDEFMQLMRAAKDGPAKLLPRLVSSLGLGRALSVLWHTAQQTKVTSFASHAFHTAAPIAFGATAARLALMPLSGDTAAPEADGDDFLAQDLAARLRRGPLSWALRAQLFVDESTTPIEDTSVPWSGPWLDLATLTLPAQDVSSARGREIGELVNALSFDPWHAVEEHRPLGAMMRARRATYGKSVLARQAASEPASVLSPG
jgi:hypothetical protein